MFASGGNSGAIDYGNYHPGPGSKATAYDERPAIGKGRYTPSTVDPRGGLGMGPPPPAPKPGVGDDIQAPYGWPADLPCPEPLAGVCFTPVATVEIFLFLDHWHGL